MNENDIARIASLIYDEFGVGWELDLEECTQIAEFVAEKLETPDAR